MYVPIRPPRWHTYRFIHHHTTAPLYLLHPHAPITHTNEPKQAAPLYLPAFPRPNDPPTHTNQNRRRPSGRAPRTATVAPPARAAAAAAAAAPPAAPPPPPRRCVPCPPALACLLAAATERCPANAAKESKQGGLTTSFVPPAQTCTGLLVVLLLVVVFGQRQRLSRGASGGRGWLCLQKDDDRCVGGASVIRLVKGKRGYTRISSHARYYMVRYLKWGRGSGKRPQEAQGTRSSRGRARVERSKRKGGTKGKKSQAKQASGAHRRI